MQLGVGDAFLKVVPLGKRVEFEDRTRGMEGSVFQQGGKKEEGGGVSAWFFDANHCPGAVVILFYVRHTGRYVLHSGDCRFDAALFSKYQKLADVIREGCLDYLHLDTTYCDPKYVFPCQKDVLQTVVAAARREDARTGGKCIFFFGSYSIGKERVFMAVANALDLNIFATKRKRTILKHLHIDKLTARLSNGPRNARVHVVAMRDLSAVGLRRYASETMFDAGFIGRGLAIAFRPTGWSYHGHGATPQRINRSKDQAVVYDVPYSEHSSYEELREFVKWAKPARLLPTVNARSSDQANKLRALLGHTDKALRYVAVEGRGASL